MSRQRKVYIVNMVDDNQRHREFDVSFEYQSKVPVQLNDNNHLELRDCVNAIVVEKTKNKNRVYDGCAIRKPGDPYNRVTGEIVALQDSFVDFMPNVLDQSIFLVQFGQSRATNIILAGIEQEVNQYCEQNQDIKPVNDVPVKRV